MKFELQAYSLPEAPKFNYEEMKAAVEKKMEDYRGLVYTDETIKDAKADRAELNSLKKQLNDERIRLGREWDKPFGVFKGQVDEIIGIIDAPVKLIDRQIKDYEKREKEIKKQQIENYFNSVNTKYKDWLKIEQFFNEKWLNKSFRLDAVMKEIDQTLDQIKMDLDEINRWPLYVFECAVVYKRTLSMDDARAEKARLIEVEEQKKRAEEKKKQQAQEAAKEAAEQAPEEEAPEAAPAVCIQEPEGIKEDRPVRYWMKFAALLSHDEALSLKGFFETSGIRFERIKED